MPPQIFDYLRPNEQIDNGEVATIINVTMDNIDVRWEYNPDDGLYYRFQDGGPHNTENSGQVTTNNVVLMMANYLQSPIDARTPDAQVLGSNTVYVFSNGTVRTGSWLRCRTTAIRWRRRPTRPARCRTRWSRHCGRCAVSPSGSTPRSTG